jgi:hypothetical protein
MVAQASACDWSFYILARIGLESYQGMTSVMPTITAAIRGFSRCYSRLKGDCGQD